MLFNSKLFEEVKKLLYRKKTRDNGELLMFNTVLGDAKRKEFMNEMEYFKSDRTSLNFLSDREKVELFEQRIITGLYRLVEPEKELHVFSIDVVKKDVIELALIDKNRIEEICKKNEYRYFVENMHKVNDYYEKDQYKEIVSSIALLGDDYNMMKVLMKSEEKQPLRYFTPKEVRDELQVINNFSHITVQVIMECYQSYFNFSKLKSNFIDIIDQYVDSQKKCLELSIEKKESITKFHYMSYKEAYILGISLEKQYEKVEVQKLYKKILEGLGTMYEGMIANNVEVEPYVDNCKEYVKRHLEEINDDKFTHVKSLPDYFSL